MPKKQTYADLGDACATAHAMDVIGDRWSMVIARELLLGPRRFADLASAVVGITPAVLTSRLRAMRETGVVEQARLDDLGQTRVYRLTEWGQGLEDVMRSLGHWAQRSPGFPVPEGSMTPDGVIVAMRTMAPYATMAEWDDGPVRIAIELHDERRPAAGVRRYRLRWDADGFELTEGADDAPAATVSGDSSVWAGVVFAGAPTNAVGIEGDRRAVERVAAAYAAIA
ncbi:winged helix-turn-helix transcriptional regulator [Nocardioides sp. NPDC059952]|uniref:winged helix-turn-helix transcriptional regulator n=1 Tax=Nocardioides sp. NPDC059952 TaxID=3347014 RepID=UPI00365B7670